MEDKVALPSRYPAQNTLSLVLATNYTDHRDREPMPTAFNRSQQCLNL
jgi:hypothetical protein